MRAGTQAALKSAEQLLKSHRLMKLASDQGISHVAGHRSYVLLGDAARLERALLLWTMKQLVQHHSFTPVHVPNLVYDNVVQACGFDPHGHRTQVYTIRGTSGAGALSESGKKRSVCLSGTSEIPLVGLHVGKTFDVDSDSPSEQLPKKYAALSRCYRAETSNVEKGLYRVHYFNKVEMVALVRGAAESAAMLDAFVAIQQNLFSQLGIEFKTVDMPPEELGPAARKKIDIEAFFPERKSFGEISSASDCVDNQCRKLDIRCRRLAIPQDGQGEEPFVTTFVHSVNGTAAATPRLLLPLIETMQMPDGRIRVPHVLRSYMRGQEFLHPLRQ